MSRVYWVTSNVEVSMKTKNPTITVLTLASFLTGSVAFAQVSTTGAVNSAAQGAANINVPSIPATTPATTASTNAAQAAANSTAAQTAAATSAANRPVAPAANVPAVATPNLGAQSSVNAGVQTNGSINTPPNTVPVASERAREVANPNSAVSSDARIRSSGNSETAGVVDSNLAGSAVIQGDVKANENQNRNAAANATANGQLNALATGAEASGVINVLNPGDIAREIRSTSDTSRDVLYAKVNAKLDTGERVLSDINRQARELRGDARTQYKAAADNVRDAEKALKRSLNDARKATNDNWSEVQARLASDYEAYASAVARAHAAATVTGATAAPAP
jgi:hypothetical protein